MPDAGYAQHRAYDDGDDVQQQLSRRSCGFSVAVAVPTPPVTHAHPRPHSQRSATPTPAPARAAGFAPARLPSLRRDARGGGPPPPAAARSPRRMRRAALGAGKAGAAATRAEERREHGTVGGMRRACRPGPGPDCRHGPDPSRNPAETPSACLSHALPPPIKKTAGFDTRQTASAAAAARVPRTSPMRPRRGEGTAGGMRRARRPGPGPVGLPTGPRPRRTPGRPAARLGLDPRRLGGRRALRPAGLGRVVSLPAFGLSRPGRSCRSGYCPSRSCPDRRCPSRRCPSRRCPSRRCRSRCCPGRCCRIQVAFVRVAVVGCPGRFSSVAGSRRSRTVSEQTGPSNTIFLILNMLYIYYITAQVNTVVEQTGLSWGEEALAQVGSARSRHPGRLSIFANRYLSYQFCL